ICDPREGHLPRDGAERIGSRGLPLFRQHRPERPTERSELQPERPPKFAMAKGVVVPKIGPDEHNHSGDSDGQPDLAAPRDVMVAEQQGIERQKPERRNRNQQRRQAGGNDPLGVGKREIAAHQEQNADRRQMAKLSRRKSNARSEEHTSELQSLRHLVCRLLLEKKKRPPHAVPTHYTLLPTAPIEHISPPS